MLFLAKVRFGDIFREIWEAVGGRGRQICEAVGLCWAREYDPRDCLADLTAKCIVSPARF